MNKQTIDIQQLQQQQIQQFMQMNVNMMQQQQQQTLAFMELMKKFAKKLFCLICARVNISLFVNWNIYEDFKMQVLQFVDIYLL